MFTRDFGVSSSISAFSVNKCWLAITLLLMEAKYNHYGMKLCSAVSSAEMTLKSSVETFHCWQVTITEGKEHGNMISMSPFLHARIDVLEPPAKNQTGLSLPA